MRVVKPATIEDYIAKHADAAAALRSWLKVVKSAKWNSIEDVRQAFSHADAATVKSGAVVTIFNVKGNTYRLIVSIHYNTQKVFIRDFMSHAEYSKNKWKDRH